MGEADGPGGIADMVGAGPWGLVWIGGVDVTSGAADEGGNILLGVTEGCSVNADADEVGIVSALVFETLCVGKTYSSLLEGCSFDEVRSCVTLIDAVAVDTSVVVIRAP